MKILSFDKHDFNKQNLVTTAKGDFYICLMCGAEGYRMGLQPYIKVNERNFKKAEGCKGSDKPVVKLPSFIKTINMPHVGVIEGWHQVRECPEKYKEKFSNDPWVWSDKRQEMVRILSDEILEKKFEN